MKKKHPYAALILCYVLWGFQPLYWAFLGSVDSYTILACRIVMAAFFSVLLLAGTHRLAELREVFCSRKLMKTLLPAVVFLLADWAVFIVAVNAGHVLDVSLGYYINPLLLFLFGVVFYRERGTAAALAALAVAAVGILVSAAAFGDIPLLSLVIAVNWAIYAVLKKRITLDGVVSIAAETLLLTVPALVFLLLFRRPELSALGGREIAFLIGSGIVTALPMFLYSDSVSHFSLIVMCFAQYLSPTFNLICGFLRGETFSASQLLSFFFFLAAVLIFTFGEIRKSRRSAEENFEKAQKES